MNAKIDLPGTVVVTLSLDALELSRLSSSLEALWRIGRDHMRNASEAAHPELTKLRALLLPPDAGIR